MRWCATEREKAQRVRFAKRAGMAFPVTALAKGSKASKGAKDCFTKLRAAEAPPASPSLRADQAPGSLSPPRRNALARQSFDALAPFAPFAGTPLPPVLYKCGGSQSGGRRRHESASHLKRKPLDCINQLCPFGALATSLCRVVFKSGKFVVSKSGMNFTSD